MRFMPLRCFVGLLLALLWVPGAWAENEWMQLKKTYRAMLIPVPANQDSLLADLIQITPETEISDQAVVELHQRYPFDLAKIKAYLGRLQANGAWDDIDYADKKRSGWEPKRHTERILEMAKLYYYPHTEYAGSAELMQAIHRALGYWFSAKLRCLNWWYNEIGIPKTLGAAFVLLEPELSPEEKAAAIEVMKNSRIAMTGQNKVWLSGNVLIRALLEGNAADLQAARDAIASEIVLDRIEGIKPDWSFHQHGAQQQFGNYGLSYISSMSFYCRLFRGTRYDFSAEQKNILASLLDKGYRWIIWHRYMDVSSLDRQLFHNAQLHKAYSTAFAAADMGMDGFPKSGNPLVGHKHFNESDYTVHRAPDWMASVKMASSRVIGTELVNEDNLLGYYLADGATYYYVRGDEYLNVFPFWDWRKIPGITSYEDSQDRIPSVNRIRSRNATHRVGGIGDGKVGLTAMELNRNGLRAYKAWFFTDEYVLCLGTGIQSDSALQVTTSVDQRLQCGTLSVWEGKKWRPLDHGAETFGQSELRLFHDQTGYLILEHSGCVAEAAHRTGQWCDFMKMYRPAQVEGDIVSIHLQHGAAPAGGAYRYVVLPASTPKQVQRFDVSRHFHIVRNDKVAQVVSVSPDGGASRTDEQMLWAVAYEPCTLELAGNVYPLSAGFYQLHLTQKGSIMRVIQYEPFRLP